MVNLTDRFLGVYSDESHERVFIINVYISIAFRIGRTYQGFEWNMRRQSHWRIMTIRFY